MRLRASMISAAFVVATGAQANPVCEAAIGAASSASAAAIPFKRENESAGDLSGRLATAFLVCVVAGAGGIYLLRKRWAPGLTSHRARRLKLLDVQRIGVKSSVVLLQWDEEELLLSESDGRMQLLAKRDACLNPRSGERG